MAKPSKPGPGRPAKPASERKGYVPVRFPLELLAEVDAMAAARLDKPERSGMIRELVAEAILIRRGASAGKSAAPVPIEARPHVAALMKRGKAPESKEEGVPPNRPAFVPRLKDKRK